MATETKEDIREVIIVMAISWLSISLVSNPYIGFLFLAVFLIFYYGVRALGSKQVKKRETKKQKMKRFANFIPILAISIIPYAFLMSIFKGRYL